MNTFFIYLIIGTYFTRWTGPVSKDTASIWFSLLLFLVCGLQVWRVRRKSKTMLCMKVSITCLQTEKGHYINSAFLTMEEDRRGQLQRWGQLFPQNQHLFYLTLIWSPWKLLKNSFPVFNPLEVVWHRRRRAFKQLLFVFPPRDRRRRSARKEKSFMSPETLTPTDQFGDKNLYQCHTLHTFMYVQLGYVLNIFSYQKYSELTSLLYVRKSDVTFNPEHCQFPVRTKKMEYLEITFRP